MNVEAFMTGLARGSVQAGVLVVLVIVTQRVFRRQLTARGRCALWSLVMLRLIIPLAPDSAFSIFNLFPAWAAPHSPASPGLSSNADRPAAPTLVVGLEATTASPTDDELPALSRWQLDAPSAREQSPALSAPLAGRIDRPVVGPPPAAAPDVSESQQAGRIASDSPRDPVVGRRGLSFPAVLFVVWLIGCGVLVGVVAIRSCRLARQCRRHRVVDDPAVDALLRECAQQLQLAARPVVLESAAVVTPALLGPFRPRLLLPEGFLGRFCERELRFVFLHELAHLRRRDLWLNWLVTLLQLLHWFNPLIWVGIARWRADRELACDALALEAAGGNQSREYGNTILRLLEGCAPRGPLPGLVGILEDPRELRRRIEQIARFRPGQRVGLAALAAAALLVTVGLTDAQSPKARDVAGSKPAESGPLRDPGATGRGEERIGTDPDPAPIGTNAEMGKVVVRVLDPGGKPVPWAKIEAQAFNRGHTLPPWRLTDSNGTFTLRYLVPPPDPRVRFGSMSYGITAHHEKFPSRGILYPVKDDREGSPAPGRGEATIRFQPGITVGGVVLDAQGVPAPNIRVLLQGSFNRPDQIRPPQDYPVVNLTDPQSPAARTDAQGRWFTDQVAHDVEFLNVTFVWPDGAREEFSTRELPYGPLVSLVPFADLRNHVATNLLSEGLIVRGWVVDEQGRPIPGATVRDGYGTGNLIRISEFSTDQEGRFERRHRAPRQWIFTASAPGRATVSVVAQVEPGMPDVRLVLPPQKPWRARTVDSEGRPLAGVKFRIDTSRTEAQILDWNGESDAEGWVVWTNAPLARVALDAVAPDLGAITKISTRAFLPSDARAALATIAPELAFLPSDDSFQRVVLSLRAREEIRLRIEADDNARPIPIAALSAQFGDTRARLTPLPVASGTNVVTVSISRTNLHLGPNPNYQRSYRLLAEASNCVSLTTGFIDFDAGDQRLLLTFQQSTHSGELTVLTPEGQPARDVRVWTAITPGHGLDSVSEVRGRNRRYAAHLMVEEWTDDLGQVCLPAGVPEAPVALFHDTGFLSRLRGDLMKSRQVRLEAYGRIEGQLFVGGAPASNTPVHLQSLVYSVATGFDFALSTQTDPEGGFVMERVPPGEYQLYRWGHPKRGRFQTSSTSLQQLPVVVRAGETLRVNYASHGRLLVGRLVPSREEAALDWQTDLHTLALKIPSAPPARHLNQEDFATREAFRKAGSSFEPENWSIEQKRRERTYALEIEPDGAFRIEDVPPGLYELKVAVTMPKRDGETFADLEKLTREIVVPEGDGPLVLGTLTLPIRTPVPSAKP